MQAHIARTVSSPCVKNATNTYISGVNAANTSGFRCALIALEQPHFTVTPAIRMSAPDATKPTTVIKSRLFNRLERQLSCGT